jgi:hypothetical protein
MKSKWFTREQKAALMDLLVLGMRADSHLALAESDRVRKYLNSLEFATDYERQQFLDASFARVNRLDESPEDTRAYMASLLPFFSTPESRQDAFATLGSLLASDGKFTPEEHEFLRSAREALQI